MTMCSPCFLLTGSHLRFIDDVVPTGTTATLPVTLTLNGTTRPLLLPNGDAVTAADLIGVNIISVFNDRFRGILSLMSRTID